MRRSAVSDKTLSPLPLLVDITLVMLSGLILTYHSQEATSKAELGTIIAREEEHSLLVSQRYCGQGNSSRWEWLERFVATSENGSSFVVRGISCWTSSGEKGMGLEVFETAF